jgi:hypothetical protein
MFAHRYFAQRYFAPRYFPPVVGGGIPPIPPILPIPPAHGGGRRGQYEVYEFPFMDEDNLVVLLWWFLSR